ncbi:hypothetical protein CPB83DRAFT_791577 [Crepidotus variabilis]|uniref:C2H2-type domain-containing protein n=1 Tax=Crepidotus variabilis TaxID=179855 RepID=A0A9P6EFE2_9AGAR|nr:hypothetical protein CPB83DRAFT_791577 [Crepidotus variabilis]
MINTRQSTVLGKRKILAAASETLVIRLTSPTLYHPEQSGSEGSVASSLKAITLPLASKSRKPYSCSFNGCTKAYAKPSRLEEHERSHTGQRPFKCKQCGKSYLRDTHLNAHARSHLPTGSRPFACAKSGCDKRFWTSQHLEVHHAWHEGARPYKCQEFDCDEAFSKHHQLRAHICSVHAPPGTKPYRCDHDACTKSFDTNQHLRNHQKTHDGKRYTCSHSTCLTRSARSTYFTTWTALQTHIRTSHPPTCPRVECHGKKFSNAGNLRAHLKLHEQRDAEAELDKADGSCANEDTQSPTKRRRRGGELGRDWKCEVDDCEKDFKSKKALQTHTNVTHLRRRDFACDQDGCTQGFGYKHLLQRHVAKVHAGEKSRDDTAGALSDYHSDSDTDPPPSEDELPDPTDDIFNIDMITGNTYARQATSKIEGAKSLQCPYPDFRALLDSSPVQTCTIAASSTSTRCEYVYSRAYDLRRHLAASHKLVSDKDVVDGWVKQEKETLKQHFKAT